MPSSSQCIAHNHVSNRAKVRSALERKPVLKSVLENPFQIRWPVVPTNVQNIVLARLVAALENIPPRIHASRKFSQTAPQQTCADRVFGASPHLVIGINVVTRALEFQLRVTRKHVVDGRPQNGDEPPSHSAPSPMAVVFVCCADVDPPALVDHIPYLVAGCNSPRNVTQPIKLVPLPKGSEPIISQILGIRRAAVIAFRHGSSLSGTIQDILDSIPVVSAPWLCPSDTQGTQLVSTHIKQIRTTAPRDMKDAREQRSKARAAAKKRASSFSRSARRKPRVMITTG